MAFTDIIEHSSKVFHSFSMNKNLNKKDQHRKLKRLNTSIINLFSRHRQTKNFEKKNSNQQIQQRNCFLHPPSILTTSELSKSISNQSITFATVFDDNPNPTPFDLGRSIENEDLVIVVPNKYVINEPIGNNSNTEPYPFRSEIFPECDSSINIINSSYSKKKSLHQPKKLRHPVKPSPSINPTDRSKSAPNLLFSISTTNDQHRSLKTFRQWFKSSSIGRFIQSFIKHSNENTKHHKQKSCIKSITTRKYSDVIY